MASEELLDRMAARLRSYSIFGQDDEDRAVLAAYDAHRQRAGEDGSEEVTGACVTLTVLPEEAEAVLQFLQDYRAPDPATVRVPRGKK